MCDDKNMSETLITSLVTLGAVALGWFLGEGTSWLRESRKQRQLISALIQELDDCESYIRRNVITSELLIQALEVNAYLGFAPIVIPQILFDHDYPEIAARLTKSERVSFSSIHTKIRQMNAMSDKIASFLEKKSSQREAIKEFAELLAVFYIIAKQTIDLIMFHKTHGRQIDAWALDSAKMIERELSYQAEVETLRAKARELGYDGVEKSIYTRI